MLYLIFSMSENIIFWITSDFFIFLLHYTSELTMSITSFFMNKIINCGYSFSNLERKEYFGTKLIQLKLKVC